MRFARVLPTMLAVLLLVATIAIAERHEKASTVDPRDLIGEWRGIWKNREQSGRWDVTIEAVEGDKVRGKVETTGAQRPTYRFEGTIEGKVIRWMTPDRQASIEVEIRGATMTGRATTELFGRSDLEARRMK